LFGGSGTTIIACEKTNRQARLVELDPKYVDVIVKRWEDYTGLKAAGQFSIGVNTSVQRCVVRHFGEKAENLKRLKLVVRLGLGD